MIRSALSFFPRLRRALALGVLAATAATLARGTETILLVDDHDVAYRSGTKRVLHSPVRHAGNPLLTGPEPRNQFGYCSVYRDPASGRYQLWYQLSGGDCVTCYAESADGLRWEVPKLGLIERKGIPTPNIVLGSEGHYGASVVVDAPGAGEAARRYKLVYWSIPPADPGQALPKDPRGPNGGMFVAFSPDGTRWTKVPGPALRGAYGRTQDPPVRGGPPYPFGEIGSVSDVLDAMYDARRQRYVVYAKAWIDAPDGKLFWKRAIARTESRDFAAWSPPQLVLAPDELDGVRPARAGGTRTGVQLHGAPVFVRHGVYFALLQVADFETHGQQPIELAVSRDGVTWSRPFRGTPFLPVGEPGQFDAGRIWSNATPVVLEDEIQFYYGAYEHPWKFGQQPYPWDGKTHIPRSGLGLATLPLDRFAGIRPLERIGHVTLKPRTVVAGTTLTLNVRAATGGTIRVELLDERGYRIAGYTKAEAVPITGDGLRQRVTWQTHPDGTIPAGNFALRVHLEAAELFAVTLH